MQKLQQGFSLLELIICMAILAIILSMSVPQFMKNRQIAIIESSALELLSFFELALSESIKRNQKLYVYYVPKKSDADGCFLLSDDDNLNVENCTIESQLPRFIFKKEQLVHLSSPHFENPTQLVFLSPITGLPSQDLSLMLNTNLENDFQSGVLIRRYKGLLGCSQTGILGWAEC